MQKKKNDDMVVNKRGSLLVESISVAFFVNKFRRVRTQQEFDELFLELAAEIPNLHPLSRDSAKRILCNAMEEYGSNHPQVVTIYSLISA